eukprot:3612_1
MAAAQVDSDREQVLWALIRIHTQQTNGNEGARSNPHEDDEKALQYCTKLESLYPDDRHSLYVASRCYSALGLYDKAIRILKRALSKISALKQSNNPALDGSADFADDIKKRITKTLIRRYHNCPNDSHETIIRYLIELIEWKYNGFQAATLQAYIEEIWKRIEYILNKHMDSVTVNKQNKDLHKMESEWNTICKLLCSIPCSIPLSAHLMNYILDVFHAKFGKYDEYLDLLRTTRDMMKMELDDDANEKPIIETPQQIKISEPGADRNQLTNDESENENKTAETLSETYDETDSSIKNICETKAPPTMDVKAIDIQTKTPHPPSKVSQTMTHRDVSSEKSDSAWGRFVPVCANHEEASLNQVFEFRDEVVTIGRATSNDVTLKCAVVSSKHCKLIRGIKDGHQAIFLEDTSTNGTWIDQTKLLKKRLRIDDGMEIIFVDAHGSKKRTKKVSYVLHLETEHKDGEESTEQSITNSDSEGETKTQETQDDENNKENRQSIKDSNKNKLKLDQLEKLGYNDRTKNLGLLKMYGGDVNLVIQDYTVQQDFKFKLQPAKQRESKPIMAEATLKTTAQRKTEAKPQAETKARKDIKKEEIASDICDSECEQEDDRLRARQLQSSDGDSSDSDSDSSSESDSDLSDSSNNSTEQSITNSDSEGETKTQETQDDEDNKDSKAETKQNDNNPNHRRKRDAAFHVEMFIYQVLRQVHPELEISKTAVRLLNSMAEDAFDRICCEAGRLCQYSNKDTLGAKEIQVATSLVVPCKLAKRAQSKAMVTPYMASEIGDCDSSESDSDSSVSIGNTHGQATESVIELKLQ